VDDEPIVRDSLAKWFREEGYEVGVAESAADALSRLDGCRFDCALVDIKMPGTDGLELQKRLREIDPNLIVIIMTGYASVESVISALKGGAYDYVTKPFDPDDIADVVRNALSHRRTQEGNMRLREAVTQAAEGPQLVGRSVAMQKIHQAVATVAPTEATVLITGESGTGKEVVARAIHRASLRRFNPLVVIYCGALTDALLESELFGHEKGAFPGARHRRKGKLEVAEGGTVFLDEIGDISLKTQTDLLRVLREHEITRVGGDRPLKVDFRCIAATSKDPDAAIEEGSFRPDLFRRLNIFRIDTPPLRDRREDIPLLVESFVQKFALSMSKRITRVAPGAMQRLQDHPWPGNVRELENTVERGMVVARGPDLREEDFTLRLHEEEEPADARTLRDVERAHILRVLEEAGGNKTRAAAILGIDRVTLHNRLKKYGWKKKADGR
jgi:DNA-binding NtrC family response regulator